MTLAIHLDAVGGAAGDMFVAAILAARPDLTERVDRDCRAVLPSGIAVRHSEATSHGLFARRFGSFGDAPRGEAAFPALLSRIERARLSEGTARVAAAILTRLARAEASVHGVSPSEVHFHEVGDWDSLADVVAAGSIAAALAPVRWTVGTLPLGSGTVTTAHGVLPVPAPATAALLRGFKVYDDGVPGERVTPTGAAILAELAKPHPAPEGRLVATGMGAGTRELKGRPNILRALLIDTATSEEAPSRVAVLTFDVDDMTGEETAIAADHLRRQAGVIDVSLAQRLGKKGRQAIEFRVLAQPDTVEAVANACLEETATIGLRWHVEARRTLVREAVTSGGVRVKRVVRPSGMQTEKVEADDLAPMPGLASRRAWATP